MYKYMSGGNNNTSSFMNEVIGACWAMFDEQCFEIIIKG